MAKLRAFGDSDLQTETGVIVGLAAEARIASAFGCIAIGGGAAQSASQAAGRLVANGARALLSFGLAGGLDPALRPGMLVIPRAVLAPGLKSLDAAVIARSERSDRRSNPERPPGTSGALDCFGPLRGPRNDGTGERESESRALDITVDPAMLEVLGGATVELVLGGTQVAPDANTKRRLWEQTRASAVDLESGAVARVARQHGLPFAVLRAVCDPAERSLPPAALLALDRRGSIQLLKVLGSVAAQPSQIPELLALARDAAAARRALIRRVAEIRQRLAGV